MKNTALKGSLENMNFRVIMRLLLLMGFDMCAYRALKKKSSSNGVSLNMRPNSNNKLGYKGVDRHQGRYRARITWRGNQYELGSFDTVEQASAEYARAVSWIKKNAELSFEDHFE